MALAFGSFDQREATPSRSMMRPAFSPVRTHSVRYDQLSASRSAQNTTAAHSELGASLRRGLPNAVRTKYHGVVSATTPKLARARNNRYKAAGWAPHNTANSPTDRGSSPSRRTSSRLLNELRVGCHAPALGLFGESLAQLAQCGKDLGGAVDVLGSVFPHPFKVLRILAGQQCQPAGNRGNAHVAAGRACPHRP